MPSLPLSIKIRDTSVKRAHFLPDIEKQSPLVAACSWNQTRTVVASVLHSHPLLLLLSPTRLCLPFSSNFHSPAPPISTQCTHRSIIPSAATDHPDSLQIPKFAHGCGVRALYQASAVPASLDEERAKSSMEQDR